MHLSEHGLSARKALKLRPRDVWQRALWLGSPGVRNRLISIALLFLLAARPWMLQTLTLKPSLRRRLLEQSDAALKDIRSRSRSSGGATDSEPISKTCSGASGGHCGGQSGLPRNASFPSGSGLGLVQSSPCSPPRNSSGGRLTRPPGAPLYWPALYAPT